MHFFEFPHFCSVRKSAQHLCLPVVFALSVSTAWAQTPPQAIKEKAVAAAVVTNPTKSTVAAMTTVLARGAAGVTISMADVLSELQRAPEASRLSAMERPDALQQIVRNLLVRRVLAAEAIRDGLAKDPIIAATAAIAQDRALSDARLARLDAQNEPSESALDAYARNMYQANSSKFDRPAQTRARHILLNNSGPESLQKAKDLLTQLRAGASFDDVAKTHSTDPGSAARGGDLGFFPNGQMVRPFDDAVNALNKPGDLSEPIETQFGYHIIRLEERKEKGRQTYEEVKPQLLSEASNAILNEARVQKIQNLNKDFVFEREAIEALAKPALR